jgi:hypothetical protein
MLKFTIDAQLTRSTLVWTPSGEPIPTPWPASPLAEQAAPLAAADSEPPAAPVVELATATVAAATGEAGSPAAAPGDASPPTVKENSSPSPAEPVDVGPPSPRAQVPVHRSAMAVGSMSAAAEPALALAPQPVAHKPSKKKSGGMFSCCAAKSSKDNATQPGVLSFALPGVGLEEPVEAPTEKQLGLAPVPTQEPPTPEPEAPTKERLADRLAALSPTKAASDEEVSDPEDPDHFHPTTPLKLNHSKCGGSALWLVHQQYVDSRMCVTGCCTQVPRAGGAPESGTLHARNGTLPSQRPAAQYRRHRGCDRR